MLSVFYVAHIWCKDILINPFFTATAFFHCQEPPLCEPCPCWVPIWLIWCPTWDSLLYFTYGKNCCYSSWHYINREHFSNAPVPKKFVFVLEEKEVFRCADRGDSTAQIFPYKNSLFFSFLPIVPWVSFWNRLFLQHWLLLMWWSLTAINNDHVCLTNLNQKEPYFIFVPWKAEPIRSKSSVNILGMGKSKTYLWCDASLQDTSK